LDELRPFDLVPLGEGRFELRAFSHDSDDPITISLDRDSGRRVAITLGEAMTHVDTPGAEARDFEVAVRDRLITIRALPGSGIRLTVTR
jgi:hypothetical protein